MFHGKEARIFHRSKNRFGEFSRGYSMHQRAAKVA
jgi:hypothetical protein